MKTLLLATALLLPLTASAEPPTDAGAILDAARTAAGGAAWDGIGLLSATGDESESGMKGTWRGTDDVKTGRMHRASDFGVIRDEEVWSDRGHWRRDISGGVHQLDSEFAKQVAATRAWLARRDYLKPGHGGAALSPVEPHDEGGRHYAVVRARPPGGHEVALWFDAASHLLAKTELVLSIHTETTTYSDYRPVDGLQLPFAIATAEDPGDIDTVTIAGYTRPDHAVPDLFAPLATPDDTTVANGSVTLPIDFDGEIVFEARINGKGPFAFIIDSGGHDILTPDAVQALGLKPKGAGVGGGAGEGTLPQQYVKVDTLQIGGVTMKNQAFTVIPMGTNFADRGSQPPLAGLLGLELFERMAIRIDYVGQTINFQPLATFRHSGAGTAVPIRFYDDMPLIEASLAGHDGIFSIDTGNSGSLVVQHVWADRVGLGEQMRKGLPLTSFGAGGASANWASRMNGLKLGDTTLNGFVGRYAGDKKGAFASIVEAGNIGNEILPNFIVTFDYGREQMWLEPGTGYKPLPFRRSGMSLFKEKPEAFQVVNIIPGSPAEQAGLRKGDTITAIDGTPAKQLSGREVLSKTTQPEGTKVRVTYMRDGKAAEAELSLRTLLP